MNTLKIVIKHEQASIRLMEQVKNHEKRDYTRERKCKNSSFDLAANEVIEGTKIKAVTPFSA